MKKLMVIAAAALAGSLFADSSVESDNIVGYETMNTPAAGQSVALSVQFTKVDGADTIKIVDLLKVSTPKAAPAFGNGGDQLWVYNPTTGWVKYWWRTANKNWVKNGTTSVTEDTVVNGDTVLFRRGNGSSVSQITLSGAVKPFEGSAVYTDILAGQSRFIGYPWPVDFDAKTLPSYQSVGAKASPAFGNGGDQIWIYDSATGWKKYWYRTASKAYCLNGTTTAAANITVPAGQGFLFRRGNGSATETITFTYPAK